MAFVDFGSITFMITGALAGSGLTFAVQSAKRTAKRQNSPLPEQLSAVRRAEFSTRPILTHHQSDWLAVLDAVTETLDRGHRVQVGINMLRLVEPAGHTAKDHTEVAAALRSEVVDYVITDAEGRPVVAVEFTTSQTGSAQAMRRAICDEALRRAGIRLIEIGPEQTDTEIAEYIYEIIDEIDNQQIAAQ